MKMKKMLIIACMMILSVGISSAFASVSEDKKDNPAKPENTENKLSDEELSRLTRRVEEIRDMDKSELSATEKSELKNELKEIKATMKNEPYIYIGGGTLILILILLIILL